MPTVRRDSLPPLPSVQTRQCGFDLEHGPAALIDADRLAGTAVGWETNAAGEFRLRLNSTHGPIRRLRVFEGVLDPTRFIPGHTVMKCCGGVSPGDPTVNVLLTRAHPPEIDDWRYSERRKDGVMRYRSELYALFFCERTGAALMLGYPEPFHQAARIHADLCPAEAGIRIRCVTYPNFVTATARNPVRSEWVFAAEATGVAGAAALFEEFLARLERNAFAAPNAQPPLPRSVALTGWSDWQFYRREITEKNVTDNTLALAPERGKLQYILIDDGFQQEFGEWIATNKKFPHGMPWLSKFIRDRGFDLGLWIAPLTAGADSALAKRHPEWLVRDRSGAIRVSHSHMGAIVALDFTHPGAQRWLGHLIRTLVHTLHARWIKLDGPILRYLEHGKFHDPQATPVSLIRTALEIVRRAAGPARADGTGVIIEGEGYYGPTFGLVDTQRVTQDIQPEWTRLKATTRDNLMNGHFHRRFWINNPDAFLLRDTPSPYRGPEIRREHTLHGAELELATTALALTGGVVMLTDNMPLLKPARAKLIDTFVPPYPDHALPVQADWLKSPYAERFELPVRDGAGAARGSAYCIGACFNWDDQARSMRYPLPAGLKNPIVIDFWRRELVPVPLAGRGRELVLNVPAHGVRLFSIRARPSGAAARRPALVGLTRHITQGGVEVSGLAASTDHLRFDLLASRGSVAVFVWTGGRKVAQITAGEKPVGHATRLAQGTIVKFVLPAGATRTVEVRLE